MTGPVFPIEFRVKKAIEEKRFAEAVQLALDLPDQPELLFEAVQGRVSAWRASGQTDFAADLIRKASQRLCGNPQRAQWLAVELARCGAVPEALMMAPDAAPVRIAACDTSIVRGEAGRAILPDELHAAHGAVIRASAAFRDGHDRVAREWLSQIGLGSPFIEWKLLMRGLMAWHANDDAKAIENWQRLDPDRLPAKIVAPLRGSIDTAWLYLQRPEFQAKIRLQYDRLLTAPLISELRALQRSIETDNPATAIPLAKKVLPILKAQCPDAVPRVVEALSLAVMTRGSLFNVDQMAKSLPAPKEDPTFDRLRALGAEHCGDLEMSRKHWLDYENVLKTRPEIFGTDSDRTRALIHWHVGQLGKMLQSRLDYDPSYIDRRRVAIKPTVKQSENEALKIAPDLKVALRSALVTAVETSTSIASILKAGERLLKHHPGDDAGLTMLIAACERFSRQTDQFRFAKELMQRNPLDERARNGAARAGRMAARACALDGDVTAARQLANEAQAIDRGMSAICRPLICMLDYSEEETAAVDELLASTAAEFRGLVAAQLFAEASAIGKSKPLKNQLAPLIASSHEGAIPFDHLDLYVMAYSRMVDERLDFPGRKSQLAKLGKKLVQAGRDPKISAEQLAPVIAMALTAHMHNDVILASSAAQRRFRYDPRFPFFRAKARYHRGTENDVRSLFLDLNIAEANLQRTTPDRRPPGMAEDIAEMRKAVNRHDASPIGGTLERLIEDLAEQFS